MKRLNAFVELQKRAVHGYMSDGVNPRQIAPWVSADAPDIVKIERFRDFPVRLGRITAIVLIQRRWMMYKTRHVSFSSTGLQMLVCTRAKNNWQKLVSHCFMEYPELCGGNLHVLFRILYMLLEDRRWKSSSMALGM